MLLIAEVREKSLLYTSIEAFNPRWKEIRNFSRYAYADAQAPTSTTKTMAKNAAYCGKMYDNYGIYLIVISISS